MATCCYCGFEDQSGDARFCSNCGNPLSSTEEIITVKNKEELIHVIDNLTKTANLQHKRKLDLNCIDVSGLTDLSCVFRNIVFFNGDYDLSRWDVSNVTKMDQTFFGTNFNVDLSSWDVSNVRSMSEMFESSKGKITGLEKWDVSNVRNMDGMFSYSEFIGDLSKWNVSNVNSMKAMFKNSKFNSDISQWNVSNVEDMSEMFSESRFAGNIDNWDVSSVVDLSKMFYRNVRFRGDLRKWKLDNLVKIESFGIKRLPAGKTTINIEGWEDQLNLRNRINLDSIEDLKKLKNIVLISKIEPQVMPIEFD